jgi:hypothetical protein
VSGGYENKATSTYSSVSGGEENVASNGGTWVGGGYGNKAEAEWVLASGRRVATQRVQGRIPPA